MLRLVVWLAIIVLGAGTAWAESGSPEVALAHQWTDLVSSGGMPLAIVVLMFAIVMLWRMIQRRDEAISARDDVISTLQNKRAEDGMTYAKLLAEQTASGAAAIGSNTTQLAAWSDRVQSAVDLIKQLGPEHARILQALDRNADKIDALPMRVGGRG